MPQNTNYEILVYTFRNLACASAQWIHLNRNDDRSGNHGHFGCGGLPIVHRANSEKPPLRCHCRNIQSSTSARTLAVQQPPIQQRCQLFKYRFEIDNGYDGCDKLQPFIGLLLYTHRTFNHQRRNWSRLHADGDRHGCTSWRHQVRYAYCDYLRWKYHLWQYWKRINKILLEPMKMRTRSGRLTGLTLIELLVGIAIAAVLATMAAPSFTNFIASQRIKGLANEITTDLSYAKMESAQRNAQVTMVFSATGYTIARDGTTIKQVIIDNNNTLTPDSGTTYTSISFDPVRSTATFTAGSGSIDISNISTSSLSLRISVNGMGRSQICSPSASITGYPSC